MNKYVVLDRTIVEQMIGNLGVAPTPDLAAKWIEDNHIPFLTIEDFQENMIANSDRWFPKAYASTHDAVINNVMGIAGEAGEVAEVYKKWHRGSMDDKKAKEQFSEESVDLMHYLFQLFYILGTDIKQVYLDKTKFNEDRFGSKEG